MTLAYRRLVPRIPFGVRVSARLIASRATLFVVVVALGAGVVGGRAATLPFADAPQSQLFAAFGPCPVAPPNRYLPSNAGCVTVSRADVDGDGRTDLVLLYATLNGQRQTTGHVLSVVRASGGTLALQVPGDLDGMTIARLRDVNARAGVEIFVHVTHITTDEIIGVYTFDGHALRRAGSFPFAGEDAGIRFGFTCHPGPRATIVEHDFQEQTPFTGIWDRTDTTFRWVGATLRPAQPRTVRGAPSPAQTGVHC